MSESIRLTQYSHGAGVDASIFASGNARAAL